MRYAVGVEMLALTYYVSTRQRVLNKGVGWKGREKWRQELKENRKRVNEITSPGSRLSPADEMSWGYIFMDRFSLPRRQVSLFCTILETGWKAWGVFGGFDPLLQSVPTTWPHPCTALCCVYLQELEQEKALPCLYTAHILSSHILVFLMAC